MESATLYVTGLPKTMCNDELEALFAQYGEVSYCRSARIKKEETSKQQCSVKTILKENIINKERHMLKYFGFDDVLINEI